MVLDPGTAMLLATAVSSAAQGGLGALGASRERKMGKKRAKEMKRETYADLLNESSMRGQQREEQALRGNARLAQRESQGMADTAALLREAFGI